MEMGRYDSATRKQPFESECIPVSPDLSLTASTAPTSPASVHSIQHFKRRREFVGSHCLILLSLAVPSNHVSIDGFLLEERKG